MIEICIRALPYTYRLVEAAKGTSISVRIGGDAGDVWSLVRSAQKWELFQGASNSSETRIELDDDTAWRLFSKGLDEDVLAKRITIDGDMDLGASIFNVIAIMA